MWAKRSENEWGGVLQVCYENQRWLKFKNQPKSLFYKRKSGSGGGTRTPDTRIMI